MQWPTFLLISRHGIFRAFQFRVNHLRSVSLPTRSPVDKQRKLYPHAPECAPRFRLGNHLWISREPVARALHASALRLVEKNTRIATCALVWARNLVAFVERHDHACQIGVVKYPDSNRSRRCSKQVEWWPCSALSSRGSPRRWPHRRALDVVSNRRRVGRCRATRRTIRPPLYASRGPSIFWISARARAGRVLWTCTRSKCRCATTLDGTMPRFRRSGAPKASAGSTVWKRWVFNSSWNFFRQYSAFDCELSAEFTQQTRRLVAQGRRQNFLRRVVVALGRIFERVQAVTRTCVSKNILYFRLGAGLMVLDKNG